MTSWIVTLLVTRMVDQVTWSCHDLLVVQFQFFHYQNLWENLRVTYIANETTLLCQDLLVVRFDFFHHPYLSDIHSQNAHAHRYLSSS